MSDENHISLVALVSENEKVAVQFAAAHIARALDQAAAAPRVCDCVFDSDMEMLRLHGEHRIVVTSLLLEVEKLEEPWPQAEMRLRAAYGALCERGAPVFVCTVLRHVGRDEAPERRDALMTRIRRLNLLAAEISREAGAFVIDLDRILADIGARRLQTDYRLAGKAAAEMSGHFMGTTFIANGLDNFVPFEIQDAAGAILASSRPVIAKLGGMSEQVSVYQSRLEVGQGRRKQIVAPVAYTVQDNYSGWLVRQVLRGTIGPGEAVQRLILASRRRGVRATAGMLVSGLRRQIQGKK